MGVGYSVVWCGGTLLEKSACVGGFGISGMLIMHVVMIAVCAAILFAGHRMKIWGPRQF